MGVGRVLLASVFELAKSMARDLGCVGVVVDAKEAAVGFSERLGVEPLEARSGELGDRPEPLPMFLPLAQVP